MKLKEYIPSLIKMAKLKRLSSEVLNQVTERDIPVIVSCTSIPSRFKVVDKTIRSVLNQTTPPQKMILWLHGRHRGKLPTSLTNMEGDKFEIRFTELDSPHCKLVPSLLAFPDKTLITCDDDLIYDQNWLESLYKSHVNHPTDIIAHILRQITYDSNSNPLPYMNWKTEKRLDASQGNLIPLGYGGVLYPPGSLATEATNAETYLKLAPKADDLWFKAMSSRNGIASRKVMNAVPAPYPMPNSQKISLKTTNVREDGNTTQWTNLISTYVDLQYNTNVDLKSSKKKLHIPN